MRNGDRPTWGHRADGVGLAGGAAVALAEKGGLYPNASASRADGGFGAERFANVVPGFHVRAANQVDAIGHG